MGLDHERRPFGRTVGREPPNEQPAVSATSSHGAAVATAGNAIEVGAGRERTRRCEQHVMFAVESREEPAAGKGVGQTCIHCRAVVEVFDRSCGVARLPGLKATAEFGSGLKPVAFQPDDSVFIRIAAALTRGPHRHEQASHGRCRQQGEERSTGEGPRHFRGCRERPRECRLVVEEPRQVRGEVGGRTIAIGRPLGEAFQADGGQIPRHAAGHPVGGRRILEQHSPEDFRLGFSREQTAACEQPIK